MKDFSRITTSRTRAEIKISTRSRCLSRPILNQYLYLPTSQAHYTHTRARAKAGKTYGASRTSWNSSIGTFAPSSSLSLTWKWKILLIFAGPRVGIHIHNLPLKFCGASGRKNICRACPALCINRSWRCFRIVTLARAGKSGEPRILRARASCVTSWESIWSG